MTKLYRCPDRVGDRADVSRSSSPVDLPKDVTTTRPQPGAHEIAPAASANRYPRVVGRATCSLGEVVEVTVHSTPLDMTTWSLECMVSDRAILSDCRGFVDFLHGGS
jgi:hypothetical protein